MALTRWARKARSPSTMGAPDLAAELPFLWNSNSQGELLVPGKSAGAPATHYGLRGNEFLQQPFTCEAVFGRQQCARIAELAAEQPAFRGKSSSVDENYRICTTRFVEENAASAFIFERLRQLTHSLNRRYNFRLSGFTEPLHFISYGPGGHFEWHSDQAGGQTSTRKISISIQLSEQSEYAGGDFEFCPHGVMTEFRGLGNALAFPSYLPHRVSPVTSGRRNALVAFIHGDAFA
jgi:PKHD-type hydroxylase